MASETAIAPDVQLDRLPKLIGVYAPSGRSGKGVVADTLIHSFGYNRVQFSAPIKSMFTELAIHAGIGGDEIARALEGDLKEKGLDALGISFRKFGETIGNDWGREIIGQDFWLNLAKKRVIEAFTVRQRVVMDDMRYPNEAEWIRNTGGILIRVARPDENGGRGAQWQSEGRLDGVTFDLDFVNDATVSDLQWRVFRDLIDHVRVSR